MHLARQQKPKPLLIARWGGPVDVTPPQRMFDSRDLPHLGEDNLLV